MDDISRPLSIEASQVFEMKTSNHQVQMRPPNTHTNVNSNENVYGIICSVHDNHGYTDQTHDNHKDTGRIKDLFVGFLARPMSYPSKC